LKKAVANKWLKRTTEDVEDISKLIYTVVCLVVFIHVIAKYSDSNIHGK